MAQAEKKEEKAQEFKLISVVVPIHNAAFYLNKCIRSLQKQTYTNLEIILVDNGSTDSTGKICDCYAAKDSRIKVVRKSFEGVSSSRNAGLRAVSGQYLVFSDADDWMPEDAIEKLYRGITSPRESDMCMGQAVFVGSVSHQVIGPDNNLSFRKDEIHSYLSFMRSIRSLAGVSTWGKI